MPAISVKFFPTILIVLDLCAAAVWGHHGDWRRVVYWTCAGLLTASVTW